MAFCATLTDISSNARIKEYPALSILQVANAPLFRMSGYEPRTRAYDVPAKGKAKDPERSKASSRARAKAAVRDIAFCNRFTYFFTWTLSPEEIDRYDSVAVGKRVQTFLKNMSSRKGFTYLCVPEYHRDGAIHFHGLCNPGDIALAPAINARTGKQLYTEREQPIFNMVDWKLGYSTCIPIDENYHRTCNYLTKYFTKDAEKILGKWYFSSRSLVKRPTISLVDGGVDYDQFLAENPGLPVVPIYLDVRMAILEQSTEGSCL